MNLSLKKKSEELIKEFETIKLPKDWILTEPRAWVLDPKEHVQTHIKFISEHLGEEESLSWYKRLELFKTKLQERLEHGLDKELYNSKI